MTAETAPRKRGLFWWPIALLWRLVTAISNRIGIVASLVTGLVLMFVGFLLTGTLVGAVIGIPLIIVGLFLLARGII
jgi:hypothetical protein